MANPNTFDPVAWLDDFKANGGWWIVTGPDKVNIGWQLVGQTESQTAAAAQLWRDIAIDPIRRSAVRALLAKEAV